MENNKRTMRQGFLWVNYSVLDCSNLNSSDKLVYMALARFADNETQTCYPAIETIATVAGLHKQTVKKSLSVLEKERLIDIEREMGQANHYYLLNPPPHRKNIPLQKQDQHPTETETDHPPEKETTNNTYINNTHINNTHITKRKYIKEKDTVREKRFDEIWQRYPKKLGLKLAKGHFNASVKNEQDWQNINKALDSYINYIKVREVKSKYIKHGSTFFNNWQDWVNYKDPEVTTDLDFLEDDQND